MKSIKGIQPQFQEIIDRITNELLINAGMPTEGIRGHVCDCNIGRAYLYERRGLFSVPYWAYKKDPGYFIYYIAHELSHVVGIVKDGEDSGAIYHKAEFYSNFKKLCPEQYQKYELNYKKTASNFGISK